MGRQNTATSHTLWLKPHSTKNKIKLAPQWTPNVKGYYGKKEKAKHRRDAAHSLTISIVSKYMYLLLSILGRTTSTVVYDAALD